MQPLVDIEHLLASIYGTSRASHSFPIPQHLLPEEHELYGIDVLGLFYPYKETVEKVRSRIRWYRRVFPRFEKIDRLLMAELLGIDLDLKYLAERYVTYREENVRQAILQSMILLALLEPLPSDLVFESVKEVSERDEDDHYMINIVTGRMLPHSIISLIIRKSSDAVLSTSLWTCFGDICIELVEL